ncbi:hypothetical protein E1669_05155 [Salmonella enterica subsp. enterica serovar Matopeni]|nr:hypothetical protein [Salmonella enterica subsp. enterica serovar Matopeni]
MNAASGGPKGERSESNLTYYVYVRFLRAVRVQTGCANNAWWDRLLVLMYTNTPKVDVFTALVAWYAVCIIIV